MKSMCGKYFGGVPRPARGFATPWWGQGLGKNNGVKATCINGPLGERRTTKSPRVGQKFPIYERGLT